MAARRYVVFAVATPLLAFSGPIPVSQAAETGSVQIIQAVPGASVRVLVDGRQMQDDVGLSTILGPYALSAGKHSVRFVDPASDIATRASVTVRAGATTDVVLHRPAAVSGTPVVNVYSTPRKPIGPGKARVLVAHTATVAPADVRVDGKVVFTNIANGEFAEADVPAGLHNVELLPTGQTEDPILGPLGVDLSPRTVTMVYAVGTPANGSMKVIAHATPLASDGTVVPGSITTGSAGLAAKERVTAFSTDEGGGSGPVPAWLWLPVVAVLALLGGRGLWSRSADTSPGPAGG